MIRFGRINRSAELDGDVGRDNRGDDDLGAGDDRLVGRRAGNDQPWDRPEASSPRQSGHAVATG